MPFDLFLLFPFCLVLGLDQFCIFPSIPSQNMETFVLEQNMLRPSSNKRNISIPFSNIANIQR